MPPSNASPCDEKAATRPYAGWRVERNGPIETPTFAPLAERRAQARRFRRAEPDHRHGHQPVDAQTAGRQARAVQQHRGRTRARRCRGHCAGIAARRNQRRPAGDEAEAPPVEECLDSGATRPPRPGRGCATRRPSACCGATAPASGTTASSRTSSPARTTRRTRSASRPQVGGADGERRRRAAGAGDAPEVRAGGAVVPGGGDDERPEPGRALDRARDGLVGEGRERLGEPDERDPRRVVRVAVRVRVDRAVEPGDELVAARVDRPAARGVRLPAGDADRQDRRPGRDAGEAGRPARADEQRRPAPCRARSSSAGSSGFAPRQGLAAPARRRRSRRSTRPRRYGCERSTPVSSRAIVTPRPSMPGQREPRADGRRRVAGCAARDGRRIRDPDRVDARDLRRAVEQRDRRARRARPRSRRGRA